MTPMVIWNDVNVLTMLQNTRNKLKYRLLVHGSQKFRKTMFSSYNVQRNKPELTRWQRTSHFWQAREHPHQQQNYMISLLNPVIAKTLSGPLTFVAYFDARMRRCRSL